MSYLRAALVVLRSATAPMTAQEVLGETIRLGLITPAGKTPRDTMSAALYKNLSNGVGLIKHQRPGPTRAIRGTVRWSVGKR